MDILTAWKSWIPRGSPYTRLWRALDKNRPLDLEQALRAGASPNAHLNGEPALVWAVRRHGNTAVAVVQLLLAAGAAVNAPDARGCTALSYTADVMGPKSIHTGGTPSVHRPWNRREGWREQPYSFSGKWPNLVPLTSIPFEGLFHEEGSLFVPDPGEEPRIVYNHFVASVVQALLLDAGAEVRVPAGFVDADVQAHWDTPQKFADHLLRHLVRHTLDARPAEDCTGPVPTWFQDQGWRRVLAVIDRGANPNTRGHRGHTALFHALYEHRDWLVHGLLQRGAIPTIPEEFHDRMGADWWHVALGPDASEPVKRGAQWWRAEQGQVFLTQVLAEVPSDPAPDTAPSPSPHARRPRM